MVAFRSFFISFFCWFLVVYCTLCFTCHNHAHADLIDTQTEVSGTPGDDTIVNDTLIDMLSDLTTTSVENVTTAATGINGYSGNDTITSQVFMDAEASATIDVSDTYDQALGATASANTTGIAGGSGMDTLTNGAPLLSGADTSAFIFEVIFQSVSGDIEAPTSAISSATGIEGGNLADTINNTSSISTSATSYSEIQESHFSFIEIPMEYAAEGDGRTIATSTGIAIDGDKQTGFLNVIPDTTETISNSGYLNAMSDADAVKYIGMIELLGAARIDDSTEANAYSAGIFGGVNDTIITNTGTIDVDAFSEADLTSWEIKMKGLMVKPVMDLFGVDVGKYTTTADALAVGIYGNTGENELYNTGSGGSGSILVLADADADSEIYTFSISPAPGYLISGFAPADIPVAMASLPDIAPITATGENTGNGSPIAYGDARTVAVANAFGMLSDQGNDKLENHVILSSTATAHAENLSLSVDINIDEKSYIPIPGAAVADASTTAIAESKGLDGGSGNDTITNTHGTFAIAMADADSLGIAATIKGSMKGIDAGVAVTDSSSAAISSAKGITGGTGGDTITNSGAVTAHSGAQDDAASVSVTLAGDKAGVAAGVSLADALTRANASSIGIDAENAGGDETASSADQIDDVTNSGEIWSTAIAGSHADAVSVTLGASLEGVAVSVSLADTDVKSDARSVGIRSGIGQDRIENRGYGIHTDATSTSSSDSVAVSVSGAYKGVAMGASYAEANTEANANAKGIDAEDSDDTILNHARMNTTSTATVDSDTVAVTASVAIYGFSAGVAMSNAQTDSNAVATGIDAGNGNDTVENTAIMTTNSSATTTTDTITIDFAMAGAAMADVSSEAKADSIGILAGGGVDDVTNTGAVNVSAVSVSDDTSTVINLAGYAGGDVGSTSTASAMGIAGGDPTGSEVQGDTLTNDTGGSISVTATANAYADHYNIQGGGLQLSNVGAKTNAYAYGISAGTLGDTIDNDGAITTSALSQVKASSFDFQLSGVQLGSVGINATGTARGIHAGGGTNTVTNTENGAITTYADLTTTTLNTQAGFGLQFLHTGVTADAISQGIFTGNDQDVITNDGTINATANSLGQAGGASIGIASFSLVNALASADIDGIYAGGENDTITNTGSIIAGAIRDGDDFLVKAHTEAVSFDFVSLVSSSLGSEANITGVQGASGNDTITNTGTIYIGNEGADDACTSLRSMAMGKSFGFGGQFLGFLTFSFAGSSARTTSIGMDGGADDDTLINSDSGAITVKARSYSDVDAEVDVGLGFTDSLAQADSRSTANATGIFGNTGNDTIENSGAIAADALTIAYAYTDAKVDLATEPEARSYARAIAHAAGIDGGADGEKHIDNYGSISTSANAGARPKMNADSADKRTHTNGYGLAQSEAHGITSDSVDTWITNHSTGSITVLAKAGTYDTEGNTGFASAEEDANIDAGYYNETTGQWTPLSAKAAGISTVTGDDIIINDGILSVNSDTDGTVYAYSSCWVRYPFSTARASVFSQSKGISAGTGRNEITNTGQVTVQALSFAQPRVYSWTRDYRATATGTGTSTAEAVGIEGDGTLSNAVDRTMDVTARATSFAYANTESENVNITAVLNATATGFKPATLTGATDLLTITNNGRATVNAIAGEDSEGHSQQIAWLRTSISTRDDNGTCTGTSVVDAAGVRAGDGEKVITNNGTLNVVGRARANLTSADGLHTYVYSRYQNPEAYSYATGTSTATGILVTGGENYIYNNGTLDIDALTWDVYGWSDTYSGWSTCYSTAESSASAVGKGVVAGDGNDTIVNNVKIDIYASAHSKSYAYADTRDNNLANEHETSHAKAEALAVGIHAGNGTNTIENHGSLSVRTYSSAENKYAGGHASVTTSSSAHASAIGIQGGDDGNYIRNAGAIQVSSIALYNTFPSWYWADATGILGGDGDDVIINEGGIATSRSVGSITYLEGAVTTSGVGIDARGGNDTVILEDGSRITGSLRLGYGDNTLILRGTPILDGAINSSFGANNSVLMDGAGSFENHLTGFRTVSKSGQGTYSVSQLDTASSLNVTQGTLQIGGDYTFYNSSEYTTTVMSDGSNGHLDILGTGNLNGAIQVNKEDAFYAHSMTYDIITADILAGEFKDISLPASTSLLAFSLEQTPDTVQISATPQSCTTVATNTTDQAIGKYLDHIAPDAQGDLESVLKIFQLLPADQFKTAFAGFSPASLGSLTDTGHMIIRNAMQPITSHLQTQRNSSPGLSFASKAPVLISHNSYTNRLPGLSLTGTPNSRTNPLGFWAKGFGRWGSQDGSDGYTGYDFDTFGGALGMEYSFRNGLIGVSAEKSNSYQEFDMDSGNGIIRTLMTSLYADVYFDNFSIESIFSYGWQDYENKRNIVIGDIVRQAQSTHDANLFSAYFNGEYTWSKGLWRIAPYGNLHYTMIDENPYTETGADDLNLILGERTTKSLVSQLGFHLSRPFTRRSGYFVPKVSLAGVYDFDIDDRAITAGFTGSPDEVFAIDAQDIDQLGLAVETELSRFYDNGFGMSLTYSGEFRESFTGHSISGMITSRHGFTTTLGYAHNFQNGQPEEVVLGELRIRF